MHKSAFQIVLTFVILLNSANIFAQSGAIVVKIPERGYYFPGETITGTVSRYTNQMIYSSTMTSSSSYLDVQNVKVTLQLGEQYPPNIQLEYFTAHLPHTFREQDSMFMMVFSISGQSTGSFPFKIRSYNPIKMSAPVFPSHNSNKISTNPLLSWASSPASSDYHVQVSTSSVFPASTKSKENFIQENKLIIDDSTITDTSIQLTALAPLTTYYWRVRPKVQTGWGEWMIPAQFRTAEVSGMNEYQEGDKVYTLSVQPQPCIDYAEINFGNSTNNSYQFSVYSILGELVYRSKEETQVTNGKLIFPTNELPTGVYVLLLTDGITTRTASFIKQ
ncbi:MAG: T9SS type A sorting domain-containing protein [Bacteroidetes bacterium]|nr:T9SS type A sorting domain-containing protein [Bacteroidota bacterium]